jgi:four helix bundle protein
LTKIAAKGHYDHVDQLVRSGGSMPRNIAEGAGEWKPKEKAKFFRYAIKHAKELLARIIPMLIRLIKLFEEGRGAVEARTGTGTGTGTGPVARARARGT